MGHREDIAALDNEALVERLVGIEQAMRASQIGVHNEWLFVVNEAAKRLSKNDK